MAWNLVAGVVDDDFLLLDDQFELDDFRAFPGSLFVRVHEGRCHQLDRLTRQLEIVGRKCRSGNDKGGGCDAEQRDTAVDHDTLLVGVCI